MNIPAANPLEWERCTANDCRSSMQEVNRIAKKTPGARFFNRAFGAVRFQCKKLRIRWKSTEDVFTAIYRNKEWNGNESVSGPGSDLAETAAVRRQLPTVFRQFGIHSMLDIPCGDFNWMKQVAFEKMDYTGADIVADLIQQNNTKFGTSNVHFCKLNLIEGGLPKVDLVLCRDCLVHFSVRDIFSALRNVVDSGSTYLLTTTFTSRRQNVDIVTGLWRPLNLEVAPFSFPPPLLIICEESTERDGADIDKSLGLWKVEDLAEGLAKHLNS